MDDRCPTATDVARAAGVSAATVSRVVNRSAGVSPEAAQRVVAAIAQLGYVRQRPVGKLRREIELRVETAIRRRLAAWLRGMAAERQLALRGLSTPDRRHRVEVEIRVLAQVAQMIATSADVALAEPPGDQQ